MIEMRWKDQLPGKSIAGGVELLKSLHWHISISRIESKLFVLSGDQPLLQASTRHEVNAFLYGLALGHAMLTDEMRDQIRAMLADETGIQDPFNSEPIPGTQSYEDFERSADDGIGRG